MSELDNNLSNYTDLVRQKINRKSTKKKSRLKQYFSSAPIAKLMASMMNYKNKEINLLDPGAGIGSLFVACIEEIISQKVKPKKISITAYEVDKILFHHIEDSFKQCSKLCKKNEISFTSKLIKKDFIKDIVDKLKNENISKFTHIIINPPYEKINSFSNTHKFLKDVNLPSVNLYSAFVSLSKEILINNGELVFISPRSFCNGSHFQSFRTKFFESMSLKKIHIFDSRSTSFRDDNVLQENIIVHAIKSKNLSDDVLISLNFGPKDENLVSKYVKKDTVVYPNDTQYFIHVVPDKSGAQISNKMRALQSTLNELDIGVSTGKVVNFRIKEALKNKPTHNTVPLIHAFNLVNGSIIFPVSNKKENYIEIIKRSKNHLVENGNYVLVKRFSTKEEKRRIVASVWNKNDFDFSLIGFENKINYFHNNGKSLELDVAKGLSIFLNSTIVDLYFRQFNGHTQVNATDLRYLQYPTFRQLKTLGSKITKNYPKQKEIDDLIEKVLFGLSKKSRKIIPIHSQHDKYHKYHKKQLSNVESLNQHELVKL